MKTILVVAVAAMSGGLALAQKLPEPIIDIHLHSLPADAQGPPPVSLCAPPKGYPPAASGGAWVETFGAYTKNPPCAHPIVSPATDRELMEKTLAIMNKRNVIAVASGSEIEKWKKAGGERILPGLVFGLYDGAPPVEAVRSMLKSGQYVFFGEVGIQYQGIEPGDARFEPYLKMAEELDIPVGIHIGPGPPGAPYIPGLQAYRARLHSPLLVEEVLIRHPRLRLDVMHAGWPMLDDMIAMMWAHPQLYVDVGVISFAIPRAEFHRYLQRIVEAGFGNRVMFGSDQMVWPDAVEVAIEAIETAPFLDEQQKRDILYNNAARFLRLTPEQIARHHGK